MIFEDFNQNNSQPTKPVYHIYCDESCHLENDVHDKMFLGALWCPANKRFELSNKIKALKKKHNLSIHNEIKWVKVSNSKLAFYEELVTLFFDEEDLHFRALVIDKKGLNHNQFNQSHDDFYYKMWWRCITQIISQDCKYRVFIDIKDTAGGQRVEKLKEVLQNTHYDYDKSIIHSVELVRSDHVLLLQLSDFLLGSISYLHREQNHSNAKQSVVSRVIQKSGVSCLKSTLPKEQKFNLFLWEADYGRK